LGLIHIVAQSLAYAVQVVQKCDCIWHETSLLYEISRGSYK
jgi:hypothetical protein